MECCKAAEEDEGGRMMVEAAEALAGMARSSTPNGGASELRTQHAMETVVTSDQVCNSTEPVVAEQVCNFAPMAITSTEYAEKVVDRNPGQLCIPSHQPYRLMKFRRRLSEAEKEERKVRRIMANRESARQTIRRRKARHVELTRKASDVFEENQNLKKQKELMVEEYNSAKGRNEFLKAQLTEAKKVAAGETEEERSSSKAEKFSSVTASAPILHNQPSIVPCFWPPMMPPSSDVFPFQCANAGYTMSSSQFPMPPRDIPCLRQGQEHSMCNATRPEAPLFVVPVPWLLPFLAHSSTNTHCCGKCSCPEARPSEDSNHLSPNKNNHMQQRMCPDSERLGGMSLPPDSSVQCSVRQPPGAIVVPGLFTPVRPRETLEPPRSCQVDDTSDRRPAPAIESTRHGFLRTNLETSICLSKKAEDVYVASEARRRRKELMKLKNIHCK